jgi:hypothetical protein
MYAPMKFQNGERVFWNVMYFEGEHVTLTILENQTWEDALLYTSWLNGGSHPELVQMNLAAIHSAGQVDLNRFATLEQEARRLRIQRIELAKMVVPLARSFLMFVNSFDGKTIVPDQTQQAANARDLIQLLKAYTTG